ncbi:MAG: hypothetical protein A3F72_05545 [Bacteroidetes bacterium RIFCSPLOWO2_12_FULL_35_15]|nr:MAG: hypothetical protein A3F72_05545 [Bacteroidetes bacterium RIFCSPLOWO2_12_FULL_35_15]
MQKLKHILFILFFLVISSELIENTLHPFTPKPLKGVYVVPAKPSFTLDNWLSGQYQDSVMKHFEQNLELHPTFIRIRNEFAFLCFKEMNVHESEIGKDNFLFETGYIISYLGRDFVGEDIVREKTMKLAYVQTELKKRNVDLLFVIAPTKASYMPENISDKYASLKKERTNYESFIEQFKKQNISYIDLSEYFIKLKPSTKYPLFTRCGIHWSGYGATLAADTLVKFMEQKKNIDITDYYYNGGELSEKPRDTDDDLGSAMNLLHDIPSYPMYYPNLVIKKDNTKIKPNVLIVGDSFVWSFIGFYKFFPELFNQNSAYWFYNRELAWENKQESNLKFPLDNKTLTEQTLKRDYILIVNNRWALNQCASGFIEQMYDLLKQEEAATKKE